MANMQNSDINGLKYWQNKYFMESMCVVAVLVFVCAVFFYFYDDMELLLIWGFLAMVLTYKMLHSLREALQTRAEQLVWEKRKGSFEGLVFDVGLGTDIEVLLAQDVVNGRQARECHNVLKTAEYMWEEDVFYTAYRLKYFTLRNTAFCGVILSIKAKNVSDGGGTEVMLIGQKVYAKGTLKDFLEEHDKIKILGDVLRFFRAEKMSITVVHGQMYCWIQTSRKLFYQFSLVGNISPFPFVSRIQQLKSMSDKLAETLKF